MKVRNLVLGLMLGVNVLTAQGAVIATGAGATTAMIASAGAMSAATTTIANTVTSNMLNSNTVVIECTLQTKIVKKEGEWLGKSVPSLKETIKNSECRWNKETMEKLNNVHYEFGKAKGIFYAGGVNHVMIELIEVK